MAVVLREVTEVLSNLRATPLEKKKSLEQLTTSLVKDNSQRIQSSILASRLIHSLLGLLRCSEDVPILTCASQLLVTITHGSDDIRIELAKLKAIKVLLPLLTPPSPASYERAWEWVPLQEQVLSALRKVTFHCEPNQSSFIRMGGARQIVRLCHYNARDIDNYPPQTKERLQDLVVGKLLIAAVVPVARQDKEKISTHFPVLHHLQNINYPMYYADLANGNKEWLTDTLVQEELGNPDANSFLREEGVSWIIVRGTHVAGPTSIWLQYSIDRTSQSVMNMFQCLQILTPPPLSSPLSHPLTLGSIYAVYLKEGDGKGEGWYRGWLLQQPDVPLGDHTFFCMDYGFTVMVPLSHVTCLPHECRGIPPQAVPCVLIGLNPPLRSYTILKHVAAILGNLALSKEIYRREIRVVGGIELLLELITNPDDEVVENAVEALLNLSLSKEVCQLLRKLGIIQILTELCISSCNSKIAMYCLGSLKNILIHDPIDCMEIFEVYNVYEKLVEWAGNIPSVVNDNLDQVLLVIEHLKNGDIPVVKGNQPLLICAPFHSSQSTACDEATPNKTMPNKVTPNKATPKKSTPPMYRILSETQRPNSAHLPNVPLSLELDAVETLNHGSQLPHPQTECVHLIDVTDSNELVTSQILKEMCSLSNINEGGSLYIGVSNNGLVRGIPLHRVQKDLFRVDIDRLVSTHLKPPLDDRYKIIFLPVMAGQETKEETSCVIHIKVLPSLTNAVHLLVMKRSNGGQSECCYISRNGHSMKLSFLEVQKLVESREVMRYKKILSSH